MKRWILLLACAGLLSGCTRYTPIEMTQTATTGEAGELSDAAGAENRAPDGTFLETPGGNVENGNTADGNAAGENGMGTGNTGSGADFKKSGDGRTALEKLEDRILHITDDDGLMVPEREPVKVKGIYVSAYVAGNQTMMDHIIEEIDETELNAVVIDFKDDDGRITTPIDCPAFTEIDACKNYVPDMKGLLAKLKEHHIYTIARVVTFKDPYLAEKKPEWSLKVADGSTYRDKKGLAWVNPYKEEVWEYLAEVGRQAAEMGFDEVQFDYIRFATDSTMKNVVFDEVDTSGRSRTDIITEFTEYIYKQLAPTGLFVSADVFGAIIGSEQDADAVGQIYGEMAANLDYICPMIYPSHYGDGNFGLDHPDMHPYETILAALQKSEEDLALYREDGGMTEGEALAASQALDEDEPLSESKHQAVVRPWLQDFTASYLKHYIKYGDEEIHKQIQAVYDAGYDEWILWSAANKYHYGALEQESAAETDSER